MAEKTISVFVESVNATFVCHVIYSEAAKARDCVLSHDEAVMVTVHDIGNNHSHFRKFFEEEDMKAIEKHLTVIHVNVPGHDNPVHLPPDNTYPSIHQLGEALEDVLRGVGVQGPVVGFGRGAGANTLCWYALTNPSRVIGLILLECTAISAGFMEWAQEKMVVLQLHKKMTNSAERFLLWHYFGSHREGHESAIKEYHDHLHNHANSDNMGHYIEAYMNRESFQDRLGEFNFNVLLVTGAHSQHAAEVESMARHMKIGKTNLLNLSDVGTDIMGEAGPQLAESVMYFLQGLGLVAAEKSRGRSLSTMSM